MSRRSASSSFVRPPRGAVLITWIEGRPPRFRLSLFPARPGIVAASARSAWQMARTFAAGTGLGIWVTSDGMTFAPAPDHPPAAASV